MFNEEGGQQNVPHFHAFYGEFQASFDFDGNKLTGEFPIRQTKYVVAWADIHQDELSALWKILHGEGLSFRIRGLDE